MQKYLLMVKETVRRFHTIRSEHIPWEKNLKVDALFKLARFQRKGGNMTNIHKTY